MDRVWGDTVLPYFNAEVNKLYKLYIFRTFKNIKFFKTMFYV